MFNFLFLFNPLTQHVTLCFVIGAEWYKSWQPIRCLYLSHLWLCPTHLSCIQGNNFFKKLVYIEFAWPQWPIFLPLAWSVNPLTPTSDQDRISPLNINSESSILVRGMKMKTQLGDYKLIQYQILQIEIISIIFMADSRENY